MSETDFQPDYDYWWHKKDLGEDDIVCLSMGVCPNAFKQYMEVCNKETRPKEEHYILESFEKYIRDKIPYGGNFFQFRNDFKEREFWSYGEGEGKTNFILALYEQGFRYLGYYMHPDFLNYLSSINEKPTHFDGYYDHKKYECDFDVVLQKGVMSEDEAIALLFGLEHSYYIKFATAFKKGWQEQTCEERFFIAQYYGFLKTHELAESTPHSLVDSYHEIKEKNLWQRDFQAYLNALYDDGYIFSDSVISQLETYGFKPEYSENGWAFSFYYHWLDQAIWSFDEAKDLYRGIDPRNRENSENRKGFKDFRIGNGAVVSGFYSYKDIDYEIISPLDEKFQRHLVAGRLQAKDCLSTGEKFFEPKVIVQWLMKNTLCIPPQALLQVLDIDEDTEVEEQRATESKEASNAQAKAAIIEAANRKKEPLKAALSGLYEKAMPLWDAYIEEHGTEPTRGITAQLLKQTHDLPWKASSIERELSAIDLKLKYQSHKQAA